MSSPSPLCIFRYVTVAAAALLISACGGGGGSGGGNNPPPPPSGGEVTVSGRITFDRPSFKAGAQSGLDLANPVESPARHVVVEAIDSTSTTTLASTTTNTNGEYSITVPANRSVFIRAKAQMLKTDAAPTWNYRVLNNTNNDALYAMDGSAFNTGTAASTRNLRAATGWGTTSYTGTRVAAPFAILDTVFETKELILSADPTRALPELDLFWSTSNRTAEFCPSRGDIGTTFYTTGGNDECVSPGQIPAGIYILGDFADGNGDTDEFDAHVIAHEFGHYYEDKFSRSDSIGGNHGGDERVDLRLAFGEGWGNAYSGMALDNPQYRDSMSGIDADFGFNMESDDQSPEGWYSEVSISELLWDIYDSGSEPGDTLALGFGPIHQAMIGLPKTTEAFTSIFVFAEALRAVSATSAPGLSTLLSAEGISTTDAFGEGETNDGGDGTVIPIYDIISLTQPKNDVCSTGTAGATDGNKLGNRKYLRFANDTARAVTITATGGSTMGRLSATDPDIFVYRQGVLLHAGTSEAPGSENLTQIPLGVGLHIIEVYDFDIQSQPATTRCMTVSIQG